MAGGIFLVREGQLVAMAEQSYASEDLLQRYLAEHPELLAGDQINSQAPRRWLLVAREAPLGTEPDAASCWSVDHLFLDQDGIPTLVEVKRSSNTQIRREIVGQLLDYAANAVVAWPVATIRAMFEAGCAQAGVAPEERLTQALGPEVEAEQYWTQVGENLHSGRLRLLLVADEIPPELRRIVEFLNNQLDHTEVLAVEVRQFIGEGATALVPRVMGKTATAEQRRRSSPGRQWDEESFFDALQQAAGADEVRIARRILEWLRTAGLESSWGRGAGKGSLICRGRGQDGSRKLFLCYTDAGVWVELIPLGEARWQEVARWYNGIDGVRISADVYATSRSFTLADLARGNSLEQLVSVVARIVAELKTGSGGAEADQPAAP